MRAYHQSTLLWCLYWYCSSHFDLKPLKEALEAYCNCEFNLFDDGIEDAWRAVGKAQRDVPAHLAQEYCRPDRSFFMRSHFNEPTLPRSLIFNDWTTQRRESLFPLTSSNSGLGFDFALMRGERAAASVWPVKWRPFGPRVDWVAINHLDRVRTEELTKLRAALNTQPMSQGMRI